MDEQLPHLVPLSPPFLGLPLAENRRFDQFVANIDQFDITKQELSTHAKLFTHRVKSQPLYHKRLGSSK